MVLVTIVDSSRRFVSKILVLDTRFLERAVAVAEGRGGYNGAYLEKYGEKREGAKGEEGAVDRLVDIFEGTV